MGMPRTGFRTLPLFFAALMMSACVGAPTANSPATPGPSATPSEAGEPSVSPSADAGGSSVAPEPQVSAPAQAVVLLRGTVYDATARVAPDGTRVAVRSLDPSRAFETTVETRGGAYVVNGAPINTQLEISATRDGWTKRTRVEVLQRNDRNLESRNVVDFGGKQNANDPAGPAYFLSNRPEVESVEPLDDATSLPNDKMQFKLVMSEALSVENQRRLASAFLIVPNSAAALSDDVALPTETATNATPALETELVGLRAGSDPLTKTSYRYRQNSGFLNGAVVSEFKWDADNRTATFRLDAPVKTQDDDEAQYAFLLIQQDDEEITDAEGLALGMNQEGKFGQLNRGEIILNAVKEADISLAEGLDTEEKRWADTHVSYTTFAVAADRTLPRLEAVLARRNYTDQTGGASERIELTFSEPMVAYPNLAGPDLLSLNNYVFAVGSTEAEASGRSLKNDGSAVEIQSGASFDLARTAIKGSTGAVVDAQGALMGGTGGNFSIALSVSNPKVVVISLPAGSLPLEANYIKVLAGTDANVPSGSGKAVTDPAGNAVAGDGNAKTGPIL